MPIVELVSEAVLQKPSFVVITGGEPTVQPNLPVLAKLMNETGLDVHLETCGAYEFVHVDIKWITLSPKREKLPTKYNLGRCNEIKIIVDHPLAISEWFSTLDAIYGSRGWATGKSIWLHPEWSQRNNREVLNAISTEIKRFGSDLNLRAGYQLHKLYLVDSLDENSKPTVPLGGNPEKGH